MRSTTPTPEQTQATELFVSLRDPLLQWIQARTEFNVTEEPSEDEIEEQSGDETDSDVEDLSIDDPHLSSVDKLLLIHRLFGQAVPLTQQRERIDILLQRVVVGEARLVEEVIALRPHLLVSLRGTATDYSGRTITGLTPIEAALAAGDIDMVNAMTPYLNQVIDARKMLQWCLQQLFPMHQGDSRLFPTAAGGLAGHRARQHANVFDFSAIDAAIRRAKPLEVTEALANSQSRFTQTEAARDKSDDELSLSEALNRFREQFAAHSQHEIIYNRQHLVRALQRFKAFAEDWNITRSNSLEHRHNKCTVFFTQVVGFVQRFAPACDAQAYSQGIENLLGNKESAKRSFAHRGNPGHFYPINLTDCTGLGFNFNHDLLQGRPSFAAIIDFSSRHKLLSMLKKFDIYRNQALQKLAQTVAATQPSAATLLPQ